MKAFILCVSIVIFSGAASSAIAGDEAPNCTLKKQILNLESRTKKVEMEEFHVSSQKECKALAKQHTTKTETEETRATSSWMPSKH